MLVVLDTNVAVVANGKSEQASPGCVLACVERLDEITDQGTLVLDDQWRIIKEYLHNLNAVGQPGVGDAFLLWVLRHQANPERCVLVPITPIDEHNFAEFPTSPALAAFDPSDRKFVAVARAHPDHPPILEAMDSKWWNFKDALRANEVTVIFLCPEDLGCAEL